MGHLDVDKLVIADVVLERLKAGIEAALGSKYKADETEVKKGNVFTFKIRTMPCTQKSPESDSDAEQDSSAEANLLWMGEAEVVDDKLNPVACIARTFEKSEYHALLGIYCSFSCIL